MKNGVCHVGLSMEDVDDLVLSGSEGRAVKCSTRDLPFLVGRHHIDIEVDASCDINNGKNQWGGTCTNLLHKFY